MSKKVGRNDPCPCGSGKKFKKCCERKMISKKFLTHKLDEKNESSGTASKISGVASVFKNLSKAAVNTASAKQFEASKTPPKKKSSPKKPKEEKPQDSEKS